jgi:hypothetical protein
MKQIFTFIKIAGFLFLIGLGISSSAQDTTLMNKDAIYGRPFLAQMQLGRTTTAVGGYLEANTNYFVSDGIEDGFSMEFRRFNIFLSSQLLPGVRFISELEFEHGTEEINLETALIDFEINPSLIFRGGILLPPVGYFNQNHDSPKWEFVDRPLVSTTIIPSTLSEVGFGFHGRFFPFNSQLSYEVYLVNGLGAEIIANEENRTSLRMGKTGILGEDGNRSPALTGRIGWQFRQRGEIGLSYYGGIYNNYKADGLTIDIKRYLNLAALDYNFSFRGLSVLGEAARVWVDIPVSMGQQFGEKQWGFHTDIIYKVIQGRLFHWEGVSLNTALRVEHLDYNEGSFVETGSNIYDHLTALVPGLSLRFSPNTLIRANYRYHWEKDILGNDTVKTAGFQVGFASYF